MGFDAQYERMVKKQLGGMITDYLRHLNGEQVDKNKQNDNMIETLKEFNRLKPKNKKTFKVLSVEEMPQGAKSKKEYQERVSHAEKVEGMDIVAIQPNTQ